MITKPKISKTMIATFLLAAGRVVGGVKLSSVSSSEVRPVQRAAGL